MMSNKISRRFVISDIHGCLKTFKSLLEKIEYSKNDKLYLLGDYIDRGPNSAGVIDYIIELQTIGYQLFPLRGNHEENLLLALNEYDSETLQVFIKKNKSTSLLNPNGQIKQRYVDFIKMLPYYYDTGDFIFVHAGINFKIQNPFQDKFSLLELRKTVPNMQILGTKRIIHGHDVKKMDEIKTAVEERKTIIPLDNGCVYNKAHKHYDYSYTGNLCCLNLDTFELTILQNCDL